MNQILKLSIITIYLVSYSSSVYTQDLNKALIASIKSANLEEVKKLIARGADVNVLVDGQLPLVEAANVQDYDVFKFLIERDNVKINQQDKDGDTAVIVAALRGNIEFMEMLKEKYADFSITNHHGKTTLIYAVYSKNEYAVDFVLKNYISVAHRDKNGEDAVSMAIRQKTDKILKKLIEYGCPITLNHVNLTYQLYFQVSNNRRFSESNSEIIGLMESIYPIHYNVDYKKAYTLVNIILSEDRKYRAEIYSCGVIKIFSLSDGKFIRAFGNIHFIKEIRFNWYNKIYLTKMKNITAHNYANYVKYIIRRERMQDFQTLDEFGVGITEYGYLVIDKGIYQIYQEIKGRNYLIRSLSWKYFAVITESVINGFHHFILYNFPSCSQRYIWDFYQNYNRLGLVTKYFNSMAIFSRDDKYFMLYFPSSSGLILIFKVSEGKLIFNKKISKDFLSVAFSQNNKKIIIRYKNRSFESYALN